MAYCTNCGKFVEDGVKFCGHCGARMVVKENSSFSTLSSSQPKQSEQPTIDQSSQRKTVFEGEVHKCPHCGAILASFVKNCPDCGFEIRGSANTSSVHEFSSNYARASTNAQKVDLIRTFVIPNTKEDILEFVILASSNIDSTTYSKDNIIVSGGVSEQDLTEAWMAKFEQAYQKANLLLSDDPTLERINKLYEDKKKALDSARTKSAGKKTIRSVFKSNSFAIIAIFGVMILIGIGLPLMMLGSGERKLEKQVKQIETYISEGNYDAALTTAYAMDDNYNSSWSETRASLINRILELQGKSESHEGKVQIPTKSLYGEQVTDVIALLESAGFTNITKEPVSHDLLTGWLDKLTDTKGEVDEVSINGTTDYTRGAWVEPDVPVIVRYND